MRSFLIRLLKFVVLSIPLLAGFGYLHLPSTANAVTHAHTADMGLHFNRGSQELQSISRYAWSPNTSPIVAQNIVAGSWSAPIAWPLVAMHAAMTPQGTVMVYDRENDYTRSVHLYDPASGGLAKLSDLTVSLFCAAHTLMPDGRILMVGGHTTGDGFGLNQANILNPATGVFSRGADMRYARWYPTLVELRDGRYVVLGGSIEPGVNANVPELYNPSTNTWTSLSTAALDVGLYPRAHLAPSGEIFVVNASGQSRFLNVGQRSWRSIGDAPAGFTSVMYRPGQILYSGAGRSSSVIDLNASSPAWQATGQMNYPRYNHNLVVVPTGDVIAIGGSSNGSNSDASGVLPAELFSASTRTWTTLASMSYPRMYHSFAMLMPDGSILVAGGGRAGSQTNYLNAEYFYPPYLFAGSRPIVTSAPTNFSRNSRITVGTPNGTSIVSAALIGLPSVTHAMDFNQRFVPLSIRSRTATSVVLNIPNSRTTIPPGHYMLFLVNNQGVPSVARIVSVG
jgi:hypothetical protein